MEMEQWWERNKDIMDGDVVRGGYTKNEIEDITGQIPLLLDNCVVKDENDQPKIDLKIQYFTDIYTQAMSFEHRMKSESKLVDWKWYATTDSTPTTSLTSLGTTII
jgi:hypothetical protein